jgi:DNA-binding Xre family transcriptional regulator
MTASIKPVPFSYPLVREWPSLGCVVVGSDRNEIVAARVGRSAMAVELRRIALGIPGRLIAMDGPKIEQLPVQRGWDRLELSRRSRVNYQALWRIETGRRLRVDRDVADQLAAALAVNPSAIVRDG